MMAASAAGAVGGRGERGVPACLALTRLLLARDSFARLSFSRFMLTRLITQGPSNDLGNLKNLNI